MSNDTLNVTILGSGTSSGVPTIGCSCSTCTSKNSKDKRLRTSILIEKNDTKVLIDTTPDFRQQMLVNNLKKIDGIVYTHAHFDHIGGFDDIRALNYTTGRPLPIFLNEETLAKIKRTFYYAFEDSDQIGGGIPLVDVNIINNQLFSINNIDLQPLLLKHGKLDVLGFRVGNFAYCTDTNFIPEATKEKLRDLDVLIIDALRITKHSTHFSIDEAVEEIYNLNPKTAYLIHLTHQVEHDKLESMLPDHIRPAFDGMRINL